MTIPPPAIAVPNRAPLGLGGRLLTIAAVVIVEAGLHTWLFQSLPHAAVNGLSAVVQDVQHLLFRFLVAYAVFAAILMRLERPESFSFNSGSDAVPPVRLVWCALHAVLALSLGAMSFALHTNALDVPYLALAAAWLLCGAAAIAALFAGFAPLPFWIRAARSHYVVLLYAIAPAAATIVAIHLSQSLWRPAARVTFDLVAMLLRPFVPHLHIAPADMTLGTDRFAVNIADVCSGLEGVGLILVFSASWLWFFRREFRFPRAFLIVPAAAVFMFLLNSVRIAALVLIGDAGYPNVATVGFHSQAGWIAFNAVALGVAVLARSTPWFRVLNGTEHAAAENATAPYLVPLLAILAAGMIAHALSAGFDFLYPVRLAAGAAALWVYRRRYGGIDWRFSWRSVAVGVLVFAAWWALDRILEPAHAMPEALAQASRPLQGIWVVCRVVAAVVTVPIAEELAYRGYLMRLMASRPFDAIGLRDVRWPALALASIAFGVTHGSMWPAGIIAGAAYGVLAIRTNRLGEAAAAHAITNALVAADVLLFGQWQLW